MPALNGTGPRGQGSRTGRGLGYCPPGYGRGYGLGYRRFGRGWGWPFYDEPTAKEEKEILTEELKGLREEMKEMEVRLEELKSKKTK